MGRRYHAMAALFGRTIVSSDVVQKGSSGIKMSYHRGVDSRVLVYVTEGFKAKEPGLTLILREACLHRWEAVTMEELVRRSKGPKNIALLLKAADEALGLQNRGRIVVLDGDAFVSWAATKFVDAQCCAWIKES